MNLEKKPDLAFQVLASCRDLVVFVWLLITVPFGSGIPTSRIQVLILRPQWMDASVVERNSHLSPTCGFCVRDLRAPGMVARAYAGHAVFSRPSAGSAGSDTHGLRQTCKRNRVMTVRSPLFRAWCERVNPFAALRPQNPHLGLKSNVLVS